MQEVDMKEEQRDNNNQLTDASVDLEYEVTTLSNVIATFNKRRAGP
jgi:hypothetical protein